MEKDRLNYIIDNIQKTNAEDVQSLLSVVESYPYFTIAQTLLAVGMELNEDVKSGRQLKLAAAMVPDRNALRHLLIESREKMKSCDLPDEFSNQGEEEVIPEKTIVIPEIDLRKSQEELSKEMALLEEKRKSLDELKALIEQSRDYRIVFILCQSSFCSSRQCEASRMRSQGRRHRYARRWSIWQARSFFPHSREK